jgi:cellulose synthase/poly-beta-1,6-N-acetylglucosamine synthase-like glycosyltransferase
VIIQILSNLFEEGYLAREKYTPLFPFFAGANVAFRRQALAEAGLYDSNCLSGEDQDMCLRIARSGWELFFEPNAKVGHKNVMSLRALVRKWFYHGFHHPYIFNKHSPRGLKVYRCRNKRGRSPLYVSLIETGFPFTAHIFLTPFFTAGILFVLTVLFSIISFWVPALGIPALLAGLLTIVRAALYFKSDINKENIFRSIMFIFLRFVINLALLLGGFLGGLKLRMLYVSSTFDYYG